MFSIFCACVCVRVSNNSSSSTDATDVVDDVTLTEFVIIMFVGNGATETMFSSPWHWYGFWVLGYTELRYSIYKKFN